MESNPNFLGVLMHRLKVKYRVSIIDESSLQEKRSFGLTGFKLIGGFLLFFLVSFLLFTLLLAIPPVKDIFIGPRNIENSAAFINLNKQLMQIENKLQNQSIYLNGLKNMLSGDNQTVLQSNPKKLNIENINTASSNSEVKSTNQISDEAKYKLQHLIPPVRGKISAKFDKSKDHLGVDIIALKNSPILSIADGVVITADYTLETGNTISIQHDNNIISVYAHNSSLLKQTGDYVTAGDAIAIIGNSGEQTSGPHLHFELWLEGNVLDPMQFIPF